MNNLHTFFFLALLLVPGLNLLIGAMVGIGTAFQLLKAQRFGQIVTLAGVAAIWTLFAFVQAYACFEPRAGIGHWVLWTIPVAGVAWLFLSMAAKTGVSGIKEQLELANGLGKGTFSFELGFGDPMRGFVFLFDRNSGHVAILTDKTHRVEPLSFIKSWQSEWITVANTTDHMIKVATKDFEQPLMTAWVQNRATADTWVERLDNLFDEIKAKAKAQPQ